MRYADATHWYVYSKHVIFMQHLYFILRVQVYEAEGYEVDTWYEVDTVGYEVDITHLVYEVCMK